MTEPEITIPPEALEAAAKALDEMHETGSGGPLAPDVWSVWTDEARAACLAMLRHWPGMHIVAAGLVSPETIILPLQKQEGGK